MDRRRIKYISGYAGTLVALLLTMIYSTVLNGPVYAVPVGTKEACRVTVNRDGIYRLSYSDLASAGLSLSQVNPRTFKLYNKGVEVAIYVKNEETRVFSSSDYIEFYGQGETGSRYTYNNVYWLTWGGSDGKRMRQRITTANGLEPREHTDVLRYEQNAVYDRYVNDPDPFYTILVGAGGVVNLSINLPGVDETKPSTVKYRLAVGSRDRPTYVGPFHAEVSVNGVRIAEVTPAEWPKPGVHEETVSNVPAGVLRNGANTIRVRRVSGAYYLNVDRFEFDYQRSFVASDDCFRCTVSDTGLRTFAVTGFTTKDVTVYDISDPAAPERVLGVKVVPAGLSWTVQIKDQQDKPSTYFLATAAIEPLMPEPIKKETISTLRSTANHADYIIITHDDFLEQVEPLADHRRTQGLDVLVVPISDIYDEFGHGLVTPEAVKEFLRFTYLHWKKPSPTYVLLVGDASYDYRGDIVEGGIKTAQVKSMVPSPLVKNIVNSIVLGEIASDDWFVCFDGDKDFYPDMLIGRFPAATRSDVSIMVNKTINYEKVGLDEEWTKRALFVAGYDGHDLREFEVINDKLALIAGEGSLKINCTGSTAPVVNSRIIGEINRGALIVTYSGHGSSQLWDGIGTIFDNADVRDELENVGKLPVVVSLSCVNGWFVNKPGPANYCLAEQLLLSADKGAVAAFTASGNSLPRKHAILATGFFKSLYAQGESVLGVAALLGKLYLSERIELEQEAIEVLRTFVLFGDPALVLRKPGLPEKEAVQNPAVFAEPGGVNSLALAQFNIADALPELMLADIAEDVAEASTATRVKGIQVPRSTGQVSTAMATSAVTGDKPVAEPMAGEATGEPVDSVSASKVIALGRVYKPESGQTLKKVVSFRSRRERNTPLMHDSAPVSEPAPWWQAIVNAMAAIFKAIAGLIRRILKVSLI